MTVAVTPNSAATAKKCFICCFFIFSSNLSPVKVNKLTKDNWKDKFTDGDE